MEQLYFFVTGLDEYLNDDFHFLSNFFVENDGFSTALIIALASSFAVAGLFYFAICNKINRLSTHLYWIISLIIACTVTVGFTHVIVINSSYQSYEDFGLLPSIDKFTYDESVNYDGDGLKQLQEASDTLVSNIRGDEGISDIVAALLCNNALYAAILFIIFSILFKGFTIHGKAIPCMWPRQLQK